MKEILQTLNLPKELLDKTEKFMNRLFGQSVDEIGKHFGDLMRFRRFKNQVKIFQRSASIMEDVGLTVRELDLKTLVPLLEFSSLEENEKLQEKWSNLIANISSNPESGLEPKLIKTLSSLSPLEAQVLDFIKECNDEKRKKYYNEHKNDKYYKDKWKSWEDVKVTYELGWKEVQEKFKISIEFTWICLDNLVSLGLIKLGQPHIHIYKDKNKLRVDESSGVFSEEKFVYLDEVDFSSEFEESGDYLLTDYGHYFLFNCSQPLKPIKPN